MKKKILIVDDSSIIRQKVRKVLEDSHYEVIDAIDGMDALAKLEQEKQIDLIISDVNMPRMDGLAMVAKAREIPSHKDVAIFMLTSVPNPEMKAKAKSLGVTAWFLKPYKVEMIVTAIEKYIGKSEI